MEELKTSEELVRHFEACLETANDAACCEFIAVLQSRIEEGDFEATLAATMIAFGI